MPLEPDRRWLTLQQAADYLGVSYRWVTLRIESGDLPAYRISPRARRVAVEDLDKLVKPETPHQQD